MLSLSNYLQSLQIEYVLGIITKKEDNQISTTGKFALYDVDCDLILNLIPQMFQLIILLTIIYKSKKIYVMYQNFFSKLFSNYQLQNPKSVNQKMIQFILNVGQQIKKIIKYRHQFSLRLIMPIFSLNAWDILFKLLLQIHFNKRQNSREQFQYICSLSILTFYLTIILQSYSKSIIKNQFTDKNSLQIRYATLDIFRTFLFHIVLVFFQSQSIIQSLLIAINSILHCFFIQKYQQINKLDKFVNIFTEATVALFSLTTYVYYKENLFTYQTILKVGFFHMGILMLSLALVFCKQIFKKISIISSKIIEYQKNKNINRHEKFC
ncbi:unnamed protein product [Paramecium pentaurelia]|uniref:Transmembrane protein n=1 Tax=Paramecium pentaurelia TaxID=43138 RepID=A0A8S1YKJ8_9CILI|nr:unnamed protein product [Paramecium pentaurelia]